MRDRKRTAHLAPDVVEVIEGDVRDRSSLDGAMVGVSIVVSAVHGFATSEMFRRRPSLAMAIAISSLRRLRRRRPWCSCPSSARRRSIRS